jgi:prepilin-type N-terminal cleavage/methylation domain-containing protein
MYKIIKNMKKRKAFTIVELLVVISIIAIVSTIAVTMVINSLNKSKDAGVVNNISQLQVSLEDYHRVEGTYPSELVPGDPIVGNLSGITFIQEVPEGIVYEVDSENNYYQISFEIEDAYDYLSAGENCAVPEGILSGQCETISPYTPPTTVDLDSGGVVTDFGNYIIHAFTSSGTYTVNSDHEIDVLVVAGGGGGGSGGSSAGGGGGAGGLIFTENYSVSTGTISVTVGAGGDGGVRSTSPQYGLKGGDSSFGAIVASGGGGGLYSGEGSVALATGGSGGGGAGWETMNEPGEAVSGQGYKGGFGYSTNTNVEAGAGAGGGAGGVGVDGLSGIGGSGGVGLKYSTIFGDSYGENGWFAGGGGGAGYTTSGTGSAGGGDGNYGGDGYNANINTGAGGGGAGGGYSGGDGGSGIVIIRYLDPNL